MAGSFARFLISTIPAPSLFRARWPKTAMAGWNRPLPRSRCLNLWPNSSRTIGRKMESRLWDKSPFELLWIKGYHNTGNIVLRAAFQRHLHQTVGPLLRIRVSLGAVAQIVITRVISQTIAC